MQMKISQKVSNYMEERSLVDKHKQYPSRICNTSTLNYPPIPGFKGINGSLVMATLESTAQFLKATSKATASPLGKEESMRRVRTLIVFGSVIKEELRKSMVAIKLEEVRRKIEHVSKENGISPPELDTVSYIAKQCNLDCLFVPPLISVDDSGRPLYIFCNWKVKLLVHALLKAFSDVEIIRLLK